MNKLRTFIIRPKNNICLYILKYIHKTLFERIEILFTNSIELHLQIYNWLMVAEIRV